MNSFIRLLLETLGISEADTIAISKIMDAYGIKPCIPRDVLQPASKGEKVGHSLVQLMRFKALDETCKKTGLDLIDSMHILLPNG